MENTKQLKTELLAKTPKKFKSAVQEAIEYGEKKHSDDKRFNGEPQINHLLRVGLEILELELDTNSVIGSILHEIDTKEEEGTEIKKLFGKEVLQIIHRCDQIKNATNSTETPDEIKIKYILNSSKDMRPVIIKIIDTLEDIKAIKDSPIEQKKEDLNNALNIYAPLAEYLDLYKIKKEIEEHAFKVYKPLEHESIKQALKKKEVDEILLKKYRETIWEAIKNLPFPKRIEGRVKSKYSIYNKLKKYEKEWIQPNIGKIDDIIAFRILTDKEDSCFLILEKFMDIGEMNYDLFDDYISNPKPNGYRSIQFPIIFENMSDLNIEIQIMTEKMYYHNTYGPASHIAYKASKSRYAKPTNKYDWVEEIHKEIKENKKLREKRIDLPIKATIFEDEVFAFTPKGKIIDLEKGDTVLDFAYKLHTEIANQAITADINGTGSKLSTVLKTGDIIEIKTDRNKKCQPIEALRYVNSMSSKFRIRNQLSKYKRKY